MTELFQRVSFLLEAHGFYRGNHNGVNHIISTFVFREAAFDTPGFGKI